MADEVEQGSGRREVWRSYRAPCIPHATGCRQCGKEISRHRAYCSTDCAETFARNHFWNAAQWEALVRSMPGGVAYVRERPGEADEGRWITQAPVCRRCGKACGKLREDRHGWGGQREAEVNHIRPVNGKRKFFSCDHHQENLEVLCHACHVVVGIEQRAAGLIGKAKP